MMSAVVRIGDKIRIRLETMNPFHVLMDHERHLSSVIGPTILLLLHKTYQVSNMPRDGSLGL